MKKAKIDSKKCDHSPFCPVKRVCPVKAVTQKRRFMSAEIPEIDFEACIGCGKCVSVCPMGAVKMVSAKG